MPYNPRSLCFKHFAVAYKTEFLWLGFGWLWIVMIYICCLHYCASYPLVFAFFAVQTFRVADKLWSMPLKDCSFHGKKITFFLCWITLALPYLCRSHIVCVWFQWIMVMSFFQFESSFSGIWHLSKLNNTSLIYMTITVIGIIKKCLKFGELLLDFSFFFFFFLLILHLLV